MQSHVFMELGHLPYGEVTADIRVEDKEGSGVATQDLVTKVVYTTSCPQRSILLKIPTYMYMENHVHSTLASNRSQDRDIQKTFTQLQRLRIRTHAWL